MKTLPKQELPTQKIILPFSKQEVLIRPYTVKEEKILLLAANGVKEDLEYVTALMQVANNCIVSGPNVYDIASFEFEYLFLKISAFSDKSFASLVLNTEDVCEKLKDERQPCGLEIAFEMGLEPVVVEKEVSSITRDKKGKVEAVTVDLGDGKLIQLKFPNFEAVCTYNQTGEIYDVLVECVDKVIDGDEVLEASSFSKDELCDWFDGLTKPQAAKVAEFFIGLPHLELKQEVGCKYCTYKKDVVFRGLDSFFM